MQLVRGFRNRNLFIFDALYLSLTPIIALYLRLDNIHDVRTFLPSLLVMTAIVLPIKMYFAYRVGLYSYYWPLASNEEIYTLSVAAVGSAVIEILMFFLVITPLGLLADPLPRSLPIINGLLSVMMMGSLRLLVKFVYALPDKKNQVLKPKPTLIIGAGIAGVAVVKQLQQHPESGLIPAGFLDDDPDKIRKKVNGVPVLGKVKDLERVLGKTDFAQVVVALPAAPGMLVRDILLTCKKYGIDSKTVPGLVEIVQGKARVEQLRSIKLEDLLRRGAIETDTTSINGLVRGKCVMVTGAGGSIGSEITRQLFDCAPSQLVLLGHGENSIFFIAQELRYRGQSNTEIISVIADIRHKDRLDLIFEQFRPSLVFHAAAHKHVGLMEDNPPEAITNNVLGTRNLVELCESHHVERFVMISSDKAVNPTSIMGCSKRVAELVVQDAGRRTGAKYSVVRFGNVLGSRGSVVPIFEKQIAQGGPITITHPEIRRYFMTIPEAVQLVLQAGTMGTGGEVFVVDMGDQIPIVEIARDLMRVNGLVEGRDIQITYTGLKPGEKLYEELFYEGDPVERTSHEKILVCKSGSLQPISMHGRQGALQDQVNTLLQHAYNADTQAIFNSLKGIVPQFEPAREDIILKPQQLPIAAS
jgi:FlaA1/EpsC-like NDP-sugar epimerase